MLVVICVWFVALKRPVYEAVLLAFIILLFVTGTWSNALVYINEGLSTSLLYSMVAFVAMSILLTKTKIVDRSYQRRRRLYRRYRQRLYGRPVRLRPG